MSDKNSFCVTLKRGLIGTTRDQRDAIRCLGLRKINDSKMIVDNPANRGQIYKVQHLVEVRAGGAVVSRAEGKKRQNHALTMSKGTAK